MTKETSNWGSDGLSSADLQIGRLSLMQSLSDQVKQEKAKAGDIVDTVTGEVLAKRGTTLEVIPVLAYREWQELEKVGGQSKVVARYPATPENEHMPNLDVLDGKTIERNLTLNFFVLLPGKLDELPYLLQFKRTSMRAGRKLSTAIQVAGFKGKSIASQTFLIGSKLESRDRNDYYVFTVEPKGPTAKEAEEVAAGWHAKLRDQRKTPSISGTKQVAALPPPIIVGDAHDDVEVPF